MTINQTNLETLQTDSSDQWLTICFDRPQVRNALSVLMVEELLTVLEKAAASEDVRGITLRGNGGIFCAGGDLKGFKDAFELTPPNVSAIADASLQAARLFERLNTMPQPVVAFVEGAAMAGGLGMVCACDIVVVEKSASFALTEVMIGIPPAQIAPYILQRVGMSHARRLMVTAAKIGAEEALAMGLANYVVDDAEAFGNLEQEIRRSVKRCAPGAIAVTKVILLNNAQLTTEERQAFAAEKFTECLTGEEGQEGISAFLEKRKPVWNDQ